MWAPAAQLRGLAMRAAGGGPGESRTLVCGCAGWALAQGSKLVFSTDTTHSMQDECVDTASTDGHNGRDSVGYPVP